ncbi:MAG: hypothetical protein SNJ68_07160 [Cyanobacteriota bacterium]
MPLLMLSTCGTSTLTNDAAGPMQALLTSTADAKKPDLTSEQQKTLDHHIQQRQNQLLQARPEQVRSLSAELNGLLSYYQGLFPSSQDVHILLATDTYQGDATAAMIQAWLHQHRCQVQLEKIPDLSVRNAEGFRVAMSELADWAERTLPGYQEQHYRIVFNLTGGFKSVNGFLQTLGMFYADECIYIFQGSTELLRIPRLPIALDPEKIIERYFPKMRQLAQGIPLSESECQGIPETLLFQADGQVLLSEWGKLVWNRCRDHYYAQRVWDPWIPQICFSNKFTNQVASLPTERRILLNKRLDQLAYHLLQGANLNSLDLKPLKGNPCPPSTYECNAWSDLDAKRIFGHFEGSIFVLDALDKGLH